MTRQWKMGAAFLALVMLASVGAAETPPQGEEILRANGYLPGE